MINYSSYNNNYMNISNSIQITRPSKNNIEQSTLSYKTLREIINKHQDVQIQTKKPTRKSNR